VNKSALISMTTAAMRFLALAILALSLASNAAEDIRVCFSPDGRCTAIITNEIARAKRTILVQAYSFTSAPIAGALRDAHRRGVAVSIILDKSQRNERYSSADFLHNAGVATWIGDNINFPRSLNWLSGLHAAG
jgi:phosphatidylserine/phosphatidylglycerophosphate/cardiolipin synthase-like enzyme